jgi:hypothetical protein
MNYQSERKLVVSRYGGFTRGEELGYSTSTVSSKFVITNTGKTTVFVAAAFVKKIPPYLTRFSLLWISQE